MIRLSILGLLVIVAICCVAPAMAATSPVPAPAAQISLTTDPFLSAATVTTSIYEALKCPCGPTQPCGSVNEDCGATEGCCHCVMPIPNVLKCVGNPN